MLLLTSGTASGSPWVREGSSRGGRRPPFRTPETCVSWLACCRAGDAGSSGMTPTRTQLSGAEDAEMGFAIWNGGQGGVTEGLGTSLLRRCLACLALSSEWPHVEQTR